MTLRNKDDLKERLEKKIFASLFHSRTFALAQTKETFRRQRERRKKEEEEKKKVVAYILSSRSQYNTLEASLLGDFSFSLISTKQWEMTYNLAGTCSTLKK